MLMLRALTRYVGPPLLSRKSGWMFSTEQMHTLMHCSHTRAWSCIPHTLGLPLAGDPVFMHTHCVPYRAADSQLESFQILIFHFMAIPVKAGQQNRCMCTHECACTHLALWDTVPAPVAGILTPPAHTLFLVGKDPFPCFWHSDLNCILVSLLSPGSTAWCVLQLLAIGHCSSHIG